MVNTVRRGESDEMGPLRPLPREDACRMHALLHGVCQARPLAVHCFASAIFFSSNDRAHCLVAAFTCMTSYTILHTYFQVKISLLIDTVTLMPYKIIATGHF